MPDNAFVLAVDELPVTLDLPPIMPGQDYKFSIEIEDDNESAIDTTGWVMEIDGRNDNANGLLAFSISSDGETPAITHTPSLGLFSIHISNTITADFVASKIAWDCKITDDSGDVIYPFIGVFNVLPVVTR